MNNILIVSTGKYPNENAGAVRQHAFAKLFEQCGYSSFVIGLGKTTDFKYKDYDGIEYTSFRAKNNNILNRALNILLFKRRLKKFLGDNPRFSKIVIVSIPINALFYLKRYAKKEAIQLIHDSVEWYSPEEYLLRNFSPSYIVNNAYNKKWIDKNFKVLTISKFLQAHYLSRKIDTVRIPVIMDINSMNHKKRTSVDKLVLVYAGAAGKKDYLFEIVEGLSLLSEVDIIKVELRIFGLNYDQLQHDIGVNTKTIEKLSSSLKCFGKVQREVVLRNLEEADFTVLLRSNTQRYAKAGFPTKVVESLASGTPVISNITSDLGDYLKDMENSIIVADCTPESFCAALMKAVRLLPKEREAMQLNARTTSERYFDYSNYVSEVKQYLFT